MSLSGNMLNNAGFKVMVVFMLLWLTILLSNVINQYEVSGDELLTNRVFDNKLDGWQSAGDVAAISIDSQSTIRLTSKNNKKIVSIKQTLENIPKGQFVRLSGVMKVKNVGRGGEIWQAARIIFVAVDAEGRSMYNVPHVLVMLNGTADWEFYSKVFVAVSHAVRYYVEVQLVNVTGVMWVKDLSLLPVKETLSFRLFQSASVLLWLVVTIWILAPYRREIFTSKGNVLILLMLIAALFASLASTDLKHGFIELLKPFLPWVEDEAMIFRVGHFLAYSLISVAVFWAVKAKRSSRAVIICFCLLVIFSMLTEVLQYLVDGRTPRISDFFVDVFGVISGFIILYILSPSLKMSLKKEVE